MSERTNRSCDLLCGSRQAHTFTNTYTQTHDTHESHCRRRPTNRTNLPPHRVDQKHTSDDGRGGHTYRTSASPCFTQRSRYTYRRLRNAVAAVVVVGRIQHDYRRSVVSSFGGHGAVWFTRGGDHTAHTHTHDERDSHDLCELARARGKN